MISMTSTYPLITDEQIAQYHEDGFLVVENLLNEELVNCLNERVEPLFSGKFENGNYPDDWTWNPYSGLSNGVAQVASVWKCDRIMASVVLSEKIGQIMATLAGWKGVRLLGDSIFQKPYGAGETVLHQDLMYPFHHTPREIIGCWIALRDALPGASTIEYVKGSHKWPCSEGVPVCHVPKEGYLSQMKEAAKRAGIEHPEVSKIKLKPGSCTFHHFRIWHGSGKNMMQDKVRRCLVFAHIPAESRFQSAGEESYVPYSFHAGRYKRYGDDSMDESFFPIVWQQDGYRTPFIASYCEDALAQNPPLVRGEANAR